MLMARLLEKALRRSEAVDREALCLVAGQKVNSLSLSLSLPLFALSLCLLSSLIVLFSLLSRHPTDSLGTVRNFRSGISKLTFISSTTVEICWIAHQ